MLNVERIRQVCERSRIQATQASWRQADAQFVALAHVPDVGVPLEGHVRGGHPLTVQRVAAPRFQFVQHGLDLRRVALVDPPDPRHRVLVLQVGHEQPHRRGDPRAHGDDGQRNFRLHRQLRCMHGSGAAERDQHKVARIIPALHGDQTDRVDHR